MDVSDFTAPEPHLIELIGVGTSNDGKTRRKRDEPTTQTPPPPSTSQPYSSGCLTKFGQYIKKHAVQIGGCALGLAILQLAGIAFSFHLVRQLKNGYYST